MTWRWAYAAALHDGEAVVVVVHEGEAGYRSAGFPACADLRAAEVSAEHHNKLRGLTSSAAARILDSAKCAEREMDARGRT